MKKQGVVMTLALVAALALPSEAVQVSWQLQGPTCGGTTGLVEIQCGAYGVFQVGGSAIESTSSCPPVIEGFDDPLHYPPQAVPDTFPYPATHVRPTGPQPGPESGSRRRQPPRAWEMLGKAPGPSPAPSPPPPMPPRPWSVIVDWEGGHGDSTTWFAKQVAGTTVDTLLARLDDPALAPLGTNVGDFHVLARLCDIAELIDDEGKHAPLVVNMSFGRAATPDDPVSAACVDSHVSCQIAKVIAYLRTKNVSFVASAGNHGETLFPASLPDVLAAGMLDVDAFLDNHTTQPAWETPGDAEGLVPGNALCVGPWAPPAGASYSSALLAGWLARVMKTNPLTDVTTGDLWVPLRDDTQNCVVLSHGTTVYPWCNEAITSIFEGLAGAYATSCWGFSVTPIDTVSLITDPNIADPLLKSFDEHASAEHPTPEPDPCVPCVGVPQNPGGGGGGGGEESLTLGTDLVLDLSGGQELAPTMHIDAAALRVGANYYPLTLTSTQLEALETHSLAQLVLTGAGELLDPGQQASLWYLMRNDPETSCADPADCFWSSTPILIRINQIIP